ASSPAWPPSASGPWWPRPLWRASSTSCSARAIRTRRASGTCAPSPPPTSDLGGTGDTAQNHFGARAAMDSPRPVFSNHRKGGAGHGMLKRPSAVSAGDRPPLGRGRDRLLRGGGQGTGGEKALGGQDAGDPPGEGPGGEGAVRQDRPHPRRSRDRPPVPEAA